MDLLHELYDSYDHAEETELALIEPNTELANISEKNFTDSKGRNTFKKIESIMKCREEYFFQAGFQAAKKLFLK